MVKIPVPSILRGGWVAPMAPGRHLIVLCILTAAPRALVAFSPAACPALAASQSAWNRVGPKFPATRRLVPAVGVRVGTRGSSRLFGKKTEEFVKYSDEFLKHSEEFAKHPGEFKKRSVKFAKRSVQFAKQSAEFVKNATAISVNSEDELDALLASGLGLEQLRVEGAVAGGKTDKDHQVLKILQDRRASGSKPQERADGHKVALVIEGGGMRGCVSAGMLASLMDLGFGDGIDGVFGSSAGEPQTQNPEHSTLNHTGGNPGANLESISYRCYHGEVAFEWVLTKDTIYLPQVCLQGGPAP